VCVDDSSKIRGFGQCLDGVVELPDTLDLLVEGSLVSAPVAVVPIPELQEHVEDVHGQAEGEHVENDPHYQDGPLLEDVDGS